MGAESRLKIYLVFFFIVTFFYSNLFAQNTIATAVELTSDNQTFNSVSFTSNADGNLGDGCIENLNRVWYKIQPSEHKEMSYTFSNPGNPTQSGISVFLADDLNAASLSDLTSESCVSIGQQDKFTKNLYYYLAVTNTLTTDITITFTPSPNTPDHVSVAAAQKITDNTFSETVDFSAVTGYGDEEVFTCGITGFPAIYYKFTPATSGTVTITITTAAGLKGINFYSSSNGENASSSQLTRINFCMEGSFSSETLTVNPGDLGTSYYAVVVVNGGSGTMTFSGTSVLPVELTIFEALLNNNTVELTWETATEINNYGFEVQRTTPNPPPLEGGGWTKVGFVEGHGTTNSPKTYTFTDDNLPDAAQVTYRLKQVDNDGTYEYSKEVTVDISTITSVEDEQKRYQFALEQNYPNPFNPVTKIKYTIPGTPLNSPLGKGGTQEGLVSLVVYDVLGKEVATLVNEVKPAGAYEVEFDASSLPSGMYFYKLEAGSFVQTKKMVLIK